MSKATPVNTVIISGSNSRKLANTIGHHYDLPVLQHKLTRFINSEMKVSFPFKLEKNTKVWIVQSTSNPANDTLMELMLLVDTLRIEGITDINAIVPYFAYARQDKQHLPGECMSLSMITSILKNLGIKKIITSDIHNAKVLADLPIEIEDQSTLPTMAELIYKDLGLNEDSEKEFILASPDQGGVKRVEVFADYFFKNPSNRKIVSIKKERELDKIHFSKAVELRGDIDRKKLILIDDISTSGGTILNAVELCRANKVEDVYINIVHADFAKGVLEKFENHDLISKLYTSNTIERPVEDIDWYTKAKILDITKSIKI